MKNNAKKVVVGRSEIIAGGARATKASAKLEGRVVPEGYERPAVVADYIKKHTRTKR